MPAFMSDPVWSKVIGVILIVLGFSFFYKSWVALIKGRMLYWDGFLPATIVSPWVVHIPPKNLEKSLTKYKEAMWVHVIMGPVFFITAILSLGAGIDMVGLPGTKMINLAFSGGREGAPPAIIFDPRTGYRFPIIPRAATQLSKIFGGKIGLSAKDQLYDSSGQPSYQDAKGQ